jgi:hypothetical protein
MSPAIVKFIWVAFRQYWAVWVTGTGIVGLVLFLLGLAQNVTGWKMKGRHYLIVLFCTFWFLATFSAWRDAENNLQMVIAQRAIDTGNLGVCRSDLRVAQTREADLQSQINGLEGTISSDQTVIAGAQKGINEAQGSVNTCFISLGKANVPPPLSIASHAIAMEHIDPKIHIGVVIGDTNRRISSFRGIVRCDQTFGLIQASMLEGTISLGPAYKQTSGQKQVEMDFNGSSWEVGHPIVAVVGGDTQLDVSKCSIRQE